MRVLVIGTAAAPAPVESEKKLQIYFYELWLFYKTEKPNRKYHERTEYD